jgi:hypothetical protein
MIPAFVPVPHHHALRHQPDKLTERRSPAYYPVWSLLIIAVDIFIIWAIAAHGREAPL